MFRPTVRAVALALLMAAAADAQEAVQVVDAPLSELGGDWVASECADTPDLSANARGQTLSFQWMDTTGLSDVVIELEIVWRHVSAPPCVPGLNGAELGPLTHPVGDLMCISGVVYPTAHVLNSLPGNFVANGLNTFTLTMIGLEGNSVGICNHPDTGRALRLVIRAGKTNPEPPVLIEPEAPQAILLIDVGLGLVIEPGTGGFVLDLQIVAILADANGDSIRLQIEIQLVGAPFTGVPTTMSQPVDNGGMAAVELPKLPEGEYLTRVRAVDERGAASEWVPVEAVFAAVGGMTEVRASSDSGAGTPVAAGSDGGSAGSCSAGQASGPGPILMVFATLILIGAAKGRGLSSEPPNHPPLGPALPAGEKAGGAGLTFQFPLKTLAVDLQERYMGHEPVRCRSCGHEVDSDTLRERYGGACPKCLGAFALEGLLAEPVQPSAPSGGEFGKYVLADQLGVGGMGEVWKAFDNELKRWVALKFLREENPKDLARFQREARTAAGLSHPNIASIYEVGETEGRHFIAMQYVEGRTMQVFPRKNRKAVVRMIRDAARAVEHAHRHGVIHRDLKPENLMVEETEEESRLMVLDFGLARPIKGGESLSKSGTVMGTLGYMSPEQAKGEKLDGRTDVYSLGATLYDILVGKPPFEGENFYDVLKRIEDEEPVPPRRIDPRIAHDLETIVLKCLEKDRERRYGSAKGLADDLDRFLEGDAILARRPSTIYRLRMKLSKRKALVATAGVAALVLSAFLGWWLFVGSPESEHARLYASAMKFWAEARGEAMAGVNPAAIAKKARDAREAFEKAIETKEDAPSQVMRARCLQLEGNDDEALKVLERARELNPVDPEARLELAKQLLLKYRDSRGLAPHTRVLEGKVARGSHFGPLSAETKENRGWRERGEKLLVDVQVHSSQVNLLKGLLAMGQGDYPRAAKALSAYTLDEGWDTQALVLESVCRQYSGDNTGAIAVLDRAIGRVPTAVHFNRRGLSKQSQGLYDEAIADFTKAIELDPAFAEAYSQRGSAKGDKGLHDEAIADSTKAIELNPKYGGAYNTRGIAKDFKGLYDEAIADYTKVIELDPKSASAYGNRGGARRMKGLYDEAMADCTKAIELDPKYASAYNNRGLVKRDKGLYDEAIADYTKAIEIDPQNPGGYGNRGVAKFLKRLLDEAIADYTRAIDLDPKNASSYKNRGVAKAAKGLLDEAIADCTKGIELDPRDPRAYVDRGLMKHSKGLIDETISDFRQALDVAPPDWPLRSTVERELTKLETPGSRDPKLKAARQLFEESNRLYSEGEYAKAIEGFRKIAGEFPKTNVGIDSAYNVACGYALLDQKSNALDWLEKAVEMGFKDVAHMEKDSDLGALRGEERYKKVVESLKSY